MAPDFWHKRSKDMDETASPVLITAARESYQDELAARKKRYFILMSVRIPALLLAAGSLALWNNPWIAMAIVAGSIPIPWIAVISANDRPPLPKGQARRYTAGSLSSYSPYALPPGRTSNQTAGTSTPDHEGSDHKTPTEDTPADDTPDHTGRPDESDPAQ